MKPINLYAELRNRIFSVLAAIDDVSGQLPWTDVTPNSSTASNLQGLRAFLLERGEQYGFYVLGRHKYCGSSRHKAAADENDYVMDEVKGCRVKFKEERFVWFIAHDQGYVWETCPCSRSGTIKKHYVLKDIVYDRGSDQEICRILHIVYCRLDAAISCAGYRKPRSGIREQLLWALLALNDAILPMSVDDYIENALQAEAAGLPTKACKAKID